MLESRRIKQHQLSQRKGEEEEKGRPDQDDLDAMSEQRIVLEKRKHFLSRNSTEVSYAVSAHSRSKRKECHHPLS